MERKRSEIIREIHRTKEETLEGLEEVRELKRKENILIHRLREYEKYKWDRFREIIKDEPYFRLEHLYKLGVPFNMAIHLSAKNAGKTTEIYREMKRLMDRGEKFLYGRVYVQEMDSAVFQFEVDVNSPVIILKKDRRYYFYSKEDLAQWKSSRSKSREEDENTILGYPKISDLDKLGIKPVGLGYTFVNSNCLGGMNYDGFTTIFFDEILSYSPINRINKRVLDAWDASISTVTRKKPDIRVFFLGNLLDVPEHPILRFYGVNIDDDLRIVKRGEGGECTILFVNSGGLYEASFRNQAAVTKHGDVEHQAFLKNNKVLKTTPNILSPRIFEAMEHQKAFALYVTPDVYYVELRSLEDDGGGPVYCVRCDVLAITTLSAGDIFTDDPNIYNKFENTTRRITIAAVFNHIFRLYRTKSLKFDSQVSLERYALILTMYKDTYLYDYAER